MVTATHRSTLIGIFDTRESAHEAVAALHRAGFGNHQITMVAHHQGQEKTQTTDLDAAKAAQVTGETKEGEGLALGAAAGAVLGGAIALVIITVTGFGPLAVAGGLLGAGTIAGLAAGVVGGAVGGGIVGALVGLDIAEDEAKLYEQELKAGRALVGVRPGDRAGEAADILRQCGGRELEPAHAATDPADSTGL
jgi:heat induced stress protein YflT